MARVYALAIMLSGAALAADLAIPGGIAAGLLHVVSVLVVMSRHAPGALRIWAALVSLAVLAGGVLSNSPVPVLHVIANRAISISVIWVVVELRIRSLRTATERQFLAAIVDSTLDPVIGNDLDGTIRSWNPAAESFHGWPAHEAIGRSVDLIVPPEKREEHGRILEDIRSGQRVRLETERVARDGIRVDVQLTVSPVKDVRGRIVGASVIERDTTELKKVERERRRIDEKLQESQRLESLAVLAGGVAHDFNNLLITVLGNVELSKSDLPRESPIHDRLDDIERAAQRAADLCRQLLAYSGKGRFVVEPIDLSSLVSEMTQLLDVSVSRATVVSLNLRTDLPAVEADATQMRQVVMNLLTNASEAIDGRSGTITISTKVFECTPDYLEKTSPNDDLSPGRYVCLEVADTGCGMDEGTKRRIFEPFFTSKPRGRGLGLAGVLGIVRGHGGALRVYSEPNRGSVFRVMLPACDARAAQQKPEEPTSEWRVDRGTKILIADDDDTVRAMARAAVDSAGFDALMATDGREALELGRAHIHEIAAVVLDMTMPRASGAEVFRELRRSRDDLPILVTSGHNEQEAIRAFAGQKNFRFIQKPWTPRQLLAAIREILTSDAVL